MQRIARGSLAVSDEKGAPSELSIRRDRRNGSVGERVLSAMSTGGIPALASHSHHSVISRLSTERSAELLVRFRSGDESAFEELFRSYAAPLCSFALHFTRSRDLAAEVVQDVFLLMWERRSRLDVQTNLRGYLYSATRNRALGVMRRDTFFQRWADRTAQEQSYDNPATPTPTAHDQLELDERRAALERAIDSLPERRRMILLLRWRDGLRNDEVAEHMGISVKTVENQITQALRTLRTRLFEHDK